MSLEQAEHLVALHVLPPSSSAPPTALFPMLGGIAPRSGECVSLRSARTSPSALGRAPPLRKPIGPAESASVGTRNPILERPMLIPSNAGRGLPPRIDRPRLR